MVKIYESPDGGETVYERDTKTGKRILIEKPTLPEWHIDDHEFSEIVHRANEGNKSLQNLLSKLKLVYNLSKGNDE